MKMTVLAFGLLAIYAVYRLGRRRLNRNSPDLLRREDTVTPEWLVDQERREWGAGIDQVGVKQWPINKTVNEAAAFNRQRLRRRA